MAAPKEPELGGAVVAPREVRGSQLSRCLLLPPWRRRRDLGPGAGGGLVPPRTRFHGHARDVDTRRTYVQRASNLAHAEERAAYPHCSRVARSASQPRPPCWECWHEGAPHGQCLESGVCQAVGSGASPGPGMGALRFSG